MDISEYEKQLNVFQIPMLLARTYDHLEKETLDELKQIACPIFVVSSNGIPKVGKSFILNRLHKHTTAFKLYAGVGSKTKGIWIKCIRHPLDSGKVLALLDTEGINNSKATIKLSAFVAHLSNIFIWNNQNRLTQDDLGTLSTIIENVKNVATSDDTAAARNYEECPTLIVALRNTILRLTVDSQEVEPDVYLEECLGEAESDDNEYKRIKQTIKAYFPKRKCFKFPPPASSSREIQQIGRGTFPYIYLDKNFLLLEKKLSEFVYRTNEPSVQNGEGFVQKVVFYHGPPVFTLESPSKPKKQIVDGQPATPNELTTLASMMGNISMNNECLKNRIDRQDVRVDSHEAFLMKRRQNKMKATLQELRKGQEKIEAIHVYERQGERNQKHDVDKIYSAHEKKTETELNQIFRTDKCPVESFQRNTKWECSTLPLPQHKVLSVKQTKVRGKTRQLLEQHGKRKCVSTVQLEETKKMLDNAGCVAISGKHKGDNNMASVKPYEESQNYFRVVSLLVKVGTSVLQKLLLKHAVSPTTTLTQHLWSNNGIIAGKRNLNQDQKDKMFPPPRGEADINTFDITLLSFLLKDTCTLSPIELTAVDDLRDCRNEIIHSSHASVSASYTPLWSKVSNIVLHITNLIGDAVFKKEIQDMIQDISHSTIDQDFMMSSVQVLRSWYDHDQDVITAMQTLAQEADKTSELRHESLKKEVQKLDEASGERHEEIVEGQERLHGQIKHVDKAAHARHEKMMEIQEDSTSELLKEIKRGNKRVQKSIKRKLQTFEKEVKKVRRSQKKIELIYDRRGERNQECDVDKIYSKHEEKMETELKQIFSSDQETIENFQRESKRKCTSQPQQHMVPRLETTTVRDFKELQKTLIELYKAKSFSEVQVSPMDDIKIPIDKIYTKLVIVEETVDTTKEGEKKRIEKPLCSYKGMFFDGNRRRKHVAVLGSAGKGKTTFCHQLAHLWCKVHDKESCEREQTSHGVASSRKDSSYDSYSEDESIHDSGLESDFDKGESLRQFEYLLLIHLRLVEGPISIYKAVCSTLLEDYGTLHVTVKKVLEQHPEKVLVICDGFDEYHDENPPSREHLHGCTVLTTMRPWKYECMRTSRYEPDTVLQLKGLENKGIEELTERMIFHLCKKEDKAKVGKCIQDIRNGKLENTAQIPLILTYLVHLWYFTQNKLSQSITVNLTKLILCILQKGEEKIKGDPNLKTIPETCRKSLPGVLHNEQELEQYGGLLLCVARLAFEGLISKNKDGSLVFRGSTLDKYFTDHSVKDACFKFGLLSESKISYEGRISTAVSFYHKLIQEFFSAIHAICSDENYQELCNFSKNTENILDMGNVYKFICGLNPEKGAKFSKHVADVISWDPRIAQRRGSFYIFTDELQQLTNLNASCLNEMEHSSCRTDHVLYITDISVIVSTPRYMECLLRNATQTVVNMHVMDVELTKTEWQLLLHVVSESPSLQTLELRDISIGDQDVGDNVAVYDVNTNTSSHSALQRVQLWRVPAPLLPLLTRVRSTTTVTQQDNGGSDGDCTAGLTSVTTGTLTYLKLVYVTMTRCEWNMLVNIVSESPSLQTLELWGITIDGDEENIDCWRQMCNTILSSQSLTKVVLCVHRTIAKMAEWGTFTPDRWRSRSSKSSWYGDFMIIVLEKI